MTASTSVSCPGSEFDDFLFATIGAETNGMLLSVLSALARLDIDPWQEAAELARLPTETATRKLAALIAGATEAPRVHLDSPTIAARLIALLPRQTSSNVSPRETFGGVAAAINTPAAVCVIFCAIFVALMMGTQFIIASHQIPARAADAPVPASSTISPQIPPPNPSR